MKRIALQLSVIFGLCILLSCSDKDRESYIWSHVWQDSDGVYNHYRIPSIIVTPNQTVLIFCEGRSGRDASNIDLLVKRSDDNGKTWSKQSIVWNDGNNTCGNPCPVIDQTTGRIILFMTWNLFEDSGIVTKTSEDTRRPFMCYSDDDGLTWSEPVDMTESCKNPDWGWYATGPGIGIQLKSERYKNRLVIPANHSYTDTQSEEPVMKGGYGYGSHVLLSDDGGLTWRMSTPIKPGCNESQVVELSDGRLMMNMRSYNGLNCRAISYSDDGGETWSPVEHALQLAEPVCQASIIEYGQYHGNKLFLFCNPAAVDERTALTVKSSFDDCKTWSNAKLIDGKRVQYSCMTVLPDGNIGILYEIGWGGDQDLGIAFVSFYPDELFKPGTLLDDDLRM
ncbi:MAG: exo-alpha-sialidase [Candidatus Neomarinimicrobiota bacterium]|nr:MAG: exo-alpha-sialidase [Candidatus Neomarinimicrobiota bacterium]